MHLESVEERGTFEQISFALILVRALDKRWSGTLLVDPPSGGQTALQFERGLVCRAVVPDGFARLGDIVVEAGVVLDDELKQALSDDVLLGEALASASVIDEKMLQRALILQLLKRLERVFGFPVGTSWSYGADVSLFEAMPAGVRIDTLRVLWAGITAHGEMGSWLPASLKRIGASRFRLRRDVNIRRFGFNGDARKLADLVRDERLTVAQLVARDIAPEPVVRSIVYLLAITRHLDFSRAEKDGDVEAPVSSSRRGALDGMPSISEDTLDEPNVADGSERSDESKAPRRVARIRLRRVAVSRAAAAPDRPGTGVTKAPTPVGVSSADQGRAGSGGDVDPFLAQVESRLAELESESPLTLLNVDSKALQACEDDDLTDFLWDAYESAARRWHPDQCPTELAELRDGMAKIYDAMGDAISVLLDPETRDDAVRAFEVAASNAAADPVSSPGSQPAVAPSPADLHAQALSTLADDRPAEALSLCQAACKAAPDDPDYRASAVWISACLDRPDLKVLVVRLDELLGQHPEHVTARYYRGMLRRRLGDDVAAKSDFERVIDADADHAGAASQLDELGEPAHNRG